MSLRFLKNARLSAMLSGAAWVALAAPAVFGQGPVLGHAPIHASFRLDARNRRLAPVRIEP